VDELLRRRTDLGWGYHTSQVSIEATALAILALRRDPAPLISTQLANGAWPSVVLPKAPPCCWTTALACIALAELAPDSPSLARGFRWLRRVRGHEGHPLWRWKFRLFDKRVRFDPAKCGWPWFEGSSSWVLPTSAAIIALRRATAGGGTEGRVSEGCAMLLDRATPLGGWNAGNGVAFDVSLDPHLDATAVALLALEVERTSTAVRSALRSLTDGIRETVSGCQSLAWALLCLRAYRDDIDDCDIIPAVADRLSRSATANAVAFDTSTIALSLLALSVHAGSASPFEVRP
jgi:hypothetical protein